MDSQLILENRLSELERLTDWVASLGRDQGLDQGLVFKLEMCLEEIVTNVMKYAYGPGDGRSIVVTGRRQGDDLILEVEDEGEPFDPLTHEVMGQEKPLEEMEIGGLGIHLTKQMMDRVEYRRQDGKNVLSLTKRIE